MEYCFRGYQRLPSDCFEEFAVLMVRIPFLFELSPSWFGAHLVGGVNHFAVARMKGCYSATFQE